VDRLRTLSVQLDDWAHSLSEVESRAAAVTAARFAVAQVGLEEDSVHRFFDSLGDVSENGRHDLKALVERLDEQAWDVQDQIDEGKSEQSEYLAAFALARAAASCWSASDPDPRQAATNAIYEAAFTTEDLSRLAQVLGA